MMVCQSIYPEVRAWLLPSFKEQYLEEGRKPGPKELRWEDNIKDWTKLTIAETHQLTKDQDAWRTLFRPTLVKKKVSMVVVWPPPHPSPQSRV